MAGESGSVETIERTVQAILGDLVLAENKIDALKSYIEGLPPGGTIPLQSPISIPLVGCTGVKARKICDVSPGLIGVDELKEVLEKVGSEIQGTKSALEGFPPEQRFKVDMLR